MAKRPTTDTRAELSNALGEALSMWNHLEDELAMIFCDCLITPRAGKAVRVYWTPKSFQARLGMVNVAVTQELTNMPCMKEQWEVLHDAARKLVGQRNKLAHGTLMAFQWRHNEELQEETCFVPYASLMLVDNFEDIVKLDGRPKDRISVAKINASIADFTELTKKLEEFRKSIHERLHLQDFMQFYFFMRSEVSDKDRKAVMAEFVKLSAKVTVKSGS